MLSKRTPWQVTKSVWYALFMREALARTTADRFAWFWMLVEPLAHIVLLSGLRVLAGQFHLVAGAPVVPWLVVGLMSFFLFRDGVTRSLGAIDSSKGLFTYRQVKAIDTVWVRCVVEGFIKTIVFIILVFGLILLGFDAYPHDFLAVFIIWIGLWLFGVGGGLVFSVVSELVPEVGRVVKIAMFPLYLVSGVLFPLNFLPEYLQQLVLLNPIVHGIESLRVAFFSNYWTLDGVSLFYMFISTLILIALGLGLHLRFSQQMKAI